MSRRASGWLAIFGVALSLVPSTWTRASAQDQAQAPSDAAAETAAGEAKPAKPWSLRLAGGAGFGARAFQLPMNNLAYRVETGLFPAVDLGFELEHAPSAAIAVGLWLRYQSSIGLVLVEEHTDGSRHSRDTRAEWVEAAARSRLQLGGPWQLSAMVGYALSELRPVGHLLIPAYYLGGPYARLELQWSIWDERVRLRIGPEAQWIAAVGNELEQLGVDSGGFAVGGTVALEVGLSAHWNVALSYRELRSWLEAPGAPAFEDAARFGLAYVTGAL